MEVKVLIRSTSRSDTPFEVSSLVDLSFLSKSSSLSFDPLCCSEWKGFETKIDGEN